MGIHNGDKLLTLATLLQTFKKNQLYTNYSYKGVATIAPNVNNSAHFEGTYYGGRDTSGLPASLASYMSVIKPESKSYDSPVIVDSSISGGTYFPVVPLLTVIKFQQVRPKLTTGVGFSPVLNSGTSGDISSKTSLSSQSQKGPISINKKPLRTLINTRKYAKYPLAVYLRAEYAYQELHENHRVKRDFYPVDSSINFSDVRGSNATHFTSGAIVASLNYSTNLLFYLRWIFELSRVLHYYLFIKIRYKGKSYK